MKTPQIPERSAVDERWRAMLLNPSPYRGRRRFFARVPSPPRCKFCAVPFAGVGGPLFTLLGFSRWPHNPKYCRRCFRMLQENHGGAEIDCSMLFADVRGSTTLAEGMRPREFNRLMGRFYDTAVSVLVAHDAYVDKFVGDEVIGIFVPAMATEAHASRAISAARALLQRTGHGNASEPWVPIGVGVNSGNAYVGAIGQGADSELTAMGDAVNVTARLSSAAAAGEILVPLDAAANAGVAVAGLERRSLELKGKTHPVEVVVLDSEPGNS